MTVIFTLHGTPHDLTVPIRLHFDGANLTTDTYFTLLYMKWGLKDPSMFILKVAKDVDMDLTLAGQVTP